MHAHKQTQSHLNEMTNYKTKRIKKKHLGHFAICKQIFRILFIKIDRVKIYYFDHLHWTLKHVDSCCVTCAFRCVWWLPVFKSITLAQAQKYAWRQNQPNKWKKKQINISIYIPYTTTYTGPKYTQNQILSLDRIQCALYCIGQFIDTIKSMRAVISSNTKAKCHAIYTN